MKTLWLWFVAVCFTPYAHAADDEAINIAWIVLASVLVFFMQAGFALLESGMSRAKNAVNVMMKNYMDSCVGGIVFWLVGFGLMFGSNLTGWFGMSHFGLHEGEPWDYTFLLFQMMFAVTAATIASGAMAERTRYSAYLIGAVLISGVIYPIFGSWVWSGVYGGQGWLAKMGFVDFAGSTVVHSVGAWCALAGILVLGPRLGRFGSDGEARMIPGHNLGMVALGGFILWFGWFGFNAGSNLEVSTSLGLIALNTHLAAVSGAIGALLAQRSTASPILLTTTVNGSLGGLVGITAGCATMAPGFAALSGLLAGFVVVFGMRLLDRLRIDDVVGAVSVHGFAGIWGTLAAGLFYQGDLFNWSRVAIQALGAASAFLWAFPMALLMYLLLAKTIGLRVTPQQEQRGLDFAEHAEVGYPEFNLAQTFDSEQWSRRG
ncbi:ammonium transporter [Pseudomonas berkeleyensis]|uniref:Ammonium transporter n=1 Tax=Pseudomonas berkeleyensis TaxID=2726956 RepID=A0A7G5DKA9_9PSED|nr:ammonium transporter [Pseudomonas berkeleyensis]QMV62184.1 ammonium transporter [Pseudomonas berkeleyensis]WSO37625.1 ammonium transporter [Pseudomonas berkeleyensis]